MNPLHYGEPLYWEERYKLESEKSMDGFTLFDWYMPFESVYAMLDAIRDFDVPQKVLVLGVGRSNVVDVLYDKGFRDITCIDISPTLIAQMQNKYRMHAGVDFYVMNACELHQFKDNTFSLVIDKGCFDAICCGMNLYESSKRYCEEVFRVLADEGMLSLMSHAPPPCRVPYLRNAPWAVDVATMTDGEDITMYILLKTKDEKVLSKQIKGAEAVIKKKNVATVSSLDQNMNSSSAIRDKKNAGLLTVTADLDTLAKMVADIDD